VRAPASSITDVGVELPTFEEVWRTLTLSAGFNARVVVLSAALLGVSAGLVGTFALLRKRTLMGDALAHATLPGIAGAFILAAEMGLVARSLTVLLPGAAVGGVIGVLGVHLLVRHTRLREDAAIGIVLAGLFGLGITLLSFIQVRGYPDAGGLNTFIYGQTAAMLPRDAALMGAIAALSIVSAVLLHKEFAIVAFNDDYALVQGWPVGRLDLLMMGLIVLVTVVGLQAVGLLLIVALLIIPPAAAAFWTRRLRTMLALAAGIGGVSGYLGASLSALAPRMPAGAVIVLTAGSVFLVSMFIAPKRGLIAGWLRTLGLRRRVAREHWLRRLYEAQDRSDRPATLHPDQLSSARNPLITLLTRWDLRLSGLIEIASGGVRLTRRGLLEGERVTSNHRLWEQYLISYADIAPSHVDLSADLVEHVLHPDLIAELERALRKRSIEIDRLPDHRDREDLA
jgi:manganese/zinc/iron transport system permease protein